MDNTIEKAKAEVAPRNPSEEKVTEPQSVNQTVEPMEPVEKKPRIEEMQTAPEPPAVQPVQPAKAASRERSAETQEKTRKKARSKSDEGNYALKTILDVRLNNGQVEFLAVWEENNAQQWVPTEWLGGGIRNYFVVQLLDKEDMKEKYKTVAEEQKKITAQKPKKQPKSKADAKPDGEGEQKKDKSAEPKKEKKKERKLTMADLISEIIDVRLGEVHVEFQLIWRLNMQKEWRTTKVMPGGMDTPYVRRFLAVDENRIKYEAACAALEKRNYEKEQAKLAAAAAVPKFRINVVRKYPREILPKKPEREPKRRIAKFKQNPDKKPKKTEWKIRDESGMPLIKNRMYSDIWRRQGWEPCSFEEAKQIQEANEKEAEPKKENVVYGGSSTDASDNEYLAPDSTTMPHIF